ncbi:nose resistant to fluoxetine protein 6-like [Toxorhynchites rutilus septentrionalis]|uniref:nose resistant to fluoxetine protein 6-like n=1 Tax=Toxorhynchites rutilus septentrionalis TaxID=329112 RepID=UPI00247AE1AF|nr:nose resistant to fluoxetine protein 6-like [Toxorhynchites rutilus septentrionalis]
MPRLSEFDDYDECLEGAPVGKVATYCSVRVVIEPNNGSEIWRLIQDFSSDSKRHFNHRHLARGICMTGCQQLFLRLNNATKSALKVDKFDIDFPYTFNGTFLEDTVIYRDRYGEMVNVCINHRLNQTHQLRAHTEIESCDKSTDRIEADWLDMTFLVVCAVIVALTIMSTYYDKSINYKQDIAHYKQDVNSKRKTIYLSFSILRNWYRLTSRAHEPIDKDLRFLQAIRFLTMYLVIMGHAVLLSAIVPSQNSYRIEKMHHDVGTMILTGGTQITQTFFAMSGFLLAIHMINYAKRRHEKLGMAILFKATFIRYIRLTPVYAFVILLHATWLAKLQDGPFWKLGVGLEREMCRRNWWTNLLYINNYVKADQACVQQGWYLGCDYQLFIIGIMLMIVTNRYRKLTIPVFVLAIVGSYILPAMFIYYQKLDGTFVITLEAQRFVFWFDDYYQKSYIPLHVNSGNYIAGMVTGFIYLNLRKNNIDPAQKKWFRILWNMVIPIAIASLLVHYIFYVNDFEKPSVWMAVYFAITKNSWGVFGCVFLLGVTYQVSPVMKRIFDHRIFEPLGRITYAAYLSHTFVMRLLFLSIRAPFRFNHIGMTSMVFSSVVFSYLMATVLCLCLELPVSALQKLIVGNLRGDNSSPEVPSDDTRMKAQNNGSIGQENNNV